MSDVCALVQLSARRSPSLWAGGAVDLAQSVVGQSRTLKEVVGHAHVLSI